MDLELSGRNTLKDLPPVAICGKEYDVVLLAGEKIIGWYGGRRGSLCCTGIEYTQKVLRLFEGLNADIAYLLGRETPPLEIPCLPQFRYVGSVSATQIVWLQLVFLCGLWNGFSKTAIQGSKTCIDTCNGAYFLHVSAGNRTPIPPEWLYCCQMGEKNGTAITVTRTREGITVQYTPAEVA